MKRYTLLFSTLIVGQLLAANPVDAAIKCWKNKEGVRECGQAVPVEYSQQEIEVLDRKGKVVKVIERALTKEERAERQRLEKIRKAEERKQAARKRQDMILLQTYTTERDLLLARKQNLRAIKSIISLTASNNNNLKENLVLLEKQAADFERGGEQPPASLIKDMNTLKNRINDNQEFIAKKTRTREQIESNFDADLERFRVLKGIKPRQAKDKKKK